MTQARLTAWTPRGSGRRPADAREVSNDIEGIGIEATANVAATTGNLFRYGGEYIYNWSTKALHAGHLLECTSTW